jgi:hypothetical protein
VLQAPGRFGVRARLRFPLMRCFTGHGHPRLRRQACLCFPRIGLSSSDVAEPRFRAKVPFFPRQTKPLGHPRLVEGLVAQPSTPPVSVEA